MMSRRRDLETVAISNEFLLDNSGVFHILRTAALKSRYNETMAEGRDARDLTMTASNRHYAPQSEQPDPEQAAWMEPLTAASSEQRKGFFSELLNKAEGGASETSTK